MSTSVTWNNTSYSVPAAGEEGWASLSDFLISLGNNAQTTNSQKIARRTATSTPVTISSQTDAYVGVNVSSAAATVNLPTGVNGQYYIIADESNAAATYNIAINRSGTDTINGATSLVLNVNKQAVFIVFSGGDWKILANTAAAITGVSDTSTIDLTNSSGTLSADIVSDSITNTQIKTTAAIARSKLASGTASYYVKNDGSGVMSEVASIARADVASGTANHVIINSAGGALSSEAYLDKTRGGTGITSTATFPSSGTVAVTTDVTIRTQGTIAANDSNVAFDNSYNKIQICTPTAARTYTLPTTGVAAGDVWEFYNRATTDTFVITVNASGGSTVDYVLPKGFIRLIALQATPTTNAHWKVLQANSGWISVTSPTFSNGFGTVSGASLKYMRSGGAMRIVAACTTSTVTANLASVTVPGGFSIDSTAVATNNTTANPGGVVGNANGNQANTKVNVVTATGTSTTLIYFGNTLASASTLVPQNGNTIIGSSTYFSLDCAIPISGWGG